MEDHALRARKLSEHIKQFHGKQQGFRVYHGSTTSTRRTVYDPKQSIDTSSFCHVLRVDEEKKVAIVEPNVDFGKLVDATLAHGLIPKIVPELSTITVGGAFSGTAGESSSFRYGLFEDTVTKIEVILANGDIRTASEAEERELLLACASSFGTIAVLTALEVQLVEAKQYVRMGYHPVTDAASAVRQIEHMHDDPSVDYIDGILWSSSAGVILVGKQVSEKPSTAKSCTFSKRRDPWFWMHAQKQCRKASDSSRSTGTPEDRKKSEGSDDSDVATSDEDLSLTLVHDYIPIREYLFRYERGAFWTVSHALKYFYVHNRAFQRWLLHDIMKTPKLTHAMHASGLASSYIAQDLAVTYSGIPEFVRTIDQETGIWPLWLCPLNKGRSWPLNAKDPEIQDRMINVGVWGMGSRKLDRFIEQNQILERKVKELHGAKCLYAQVYCTEDEFWDTYDRQKYEALREAYGAQTLPNVFEKVSKNSALDEMQKRSTSKKEARKGKLKDVWIFRGLYGVACLTFGGNYLLKK